jgi:hypothetical protein
MLAVNPCCCSSTYIGLVGMETKGYTVTEAARFPTTKGKVLCDNGIAIEICVTCDLVVVDDGMIMTKDCRLSGS